MKKDSWTDYRWFILGASLTASKIFWAGEGNTNKHLNSKVSKDGVGSISYKNKG